MRVLQQEMITSSSIDLERTKITSLITKFPHETTKEGDDLY
jgi:hypothetical protein